MLFYALCLYVIFYHVFKILLISVRGPTKISENLLVITWILILSSNFHRHLWSGYLGLVYNDSSDFATFGSTHWSLPVLACLASVAILLGPFEWRRNVVLSTEVHFREHVEIAGARSGGKQWARYFLWGIFSQRARCVQAHCHSVTTSFRSSTSQADCALHFASVVSKSRSKTSHWQSE
jgi:hypothetical protein